jgi:hypothetical protein
MENFIMEQRAKIFLSKINIKLFHAKRTSRPNKIVDSRMIALATTIWL